MAIGHYHTAGDPPSVASSELATIPIYHERDLKQDSSDYVAQESHSVISRQNRIIEESGDDM